MTAEGSENLPVSAGIKTPFQKKNPGKTPGFFSFFNI